MIFSLISLKNWDDNRGIPDIGYQVNDKYYSGLSGLFPDVFVIKPADSGQRNHFVIIRSLLLNRAT